jgi:hypothetical protein
MIATTANDSAKQSVSWAPTEDAATHQLRNLHKDPVMMHKTLIQINDQLLKMATLCGVIPHDEEREVGLLVVEVNNDDLNEVQLPGLQSVSSLTEVDRFRAALRFAKFVLRV